MTLFLGIDGNNIVATLHTLSIILLVVVIVIAAVKTFPRLIMVRKNRDTGTIRKRVDRSFAKTESKIKKN